MNGVRRTVLVFGIVFILVAVVGLVTPGGLTMVSDLQRAPHAFGLFPVNLPHNLVHLGFGIWGLLAARSHAGAVNYARIGGVAYLLLAVLGFATPELFGLMPIGGNDIWLHLLLGAVLASVGFATRAPRHA
jgi:hypothetical protein